MLNRWYKGLLIAVIAAVRLAPVSAEAQRCTIDYKDPYVSFVSSLAEETLGNLYRMNFIAGQLCNRLEDSARGSSIPMVAMAFSLEFNALKQLIDDRSSASYVDHIPYPDSPSFSLTLSQTNRAYVAKILNTKWLGVSQVSVAGRDAVSIKRAACAAQVPLYNAIVKTAVCK